MGMSLHDFIIYNIYTRGCVTHYTRASITTAGRSQTGTVMERRLLDYYELGDVIGEGGFGSVCAGTSRQNGDAVRAYMYQVQLSVYPLCVCTLPALLAVTNSTVGVLACLDFWSYV